MRVPYKCNHIETKHFTIADMHHEIDSLFNIWYRSIKCSRVDYFITVRSVI